MSISSVNPSLYSYTVPMEVSSTIPKEPEVKTSYHNNFLINQHNHLLNTFFGLDLSKASHVNFERVRTQLREGASYLEKS